MLSNKEIEGMVARFPNLKDSNLTKTAKTTLVDLADYAFKKGFAYKPPMLSYDIVDNAIIAEWRILNNSVLTVENGVVSYFILTDDTVANAIEGELVIDTDYDTFCVNTFIKKMETKSPINPAQIMVNKLLLINRTQNYPPVNYRIFDFRLRLYRCTRVVSFVTLAKVIETDVATVKDWYHKRCKPSKEEYDRVMNILDIADGIV